MNKARPRGSVAQKWYDRHEDIKERLRLVVEEARQYNEEYRYSLKSKDENIAKLSGDVERISRMYAQLDARLAAMRYAMGVVASFDADRWSAHFKAYELKK